MQPPSHRRLAVIRLEKPLEPICPVSVIFTGTHLFCRVLELMSLRHSIFPLFVGFPPMPALVLLADTDKDGRLTLTEMIESPFVFYSAIFSDDEDEDYDFHDEFR